MNKNQEEQNDKFLWISYSDLSTSLLLSFMLICLLSIQRERSATRRQEEAIAENKRLSKSIGKTISLRNTLSGELKALAQKMVVDFRSKCPGVTWEAQEDGIRVSSDGAGKNESMWFNEGSDLINPEGKACLKAFAPLWVDIFHRDPQARAAVSQLLIEGHTNSHGSFMFNLDLSQRRAFAAAKFIMEEIKGAEADQVLVNAGRWVELQAWAQRVVAANGRSKNDLLFEPNSQTEDFVKSKRVEFKFVLRTDYQELEKLMLPGGGK